MPLIENSRKGLYICIILMRNALKHAKKAGLTFSNKGA